MSYFETIFRTITHHPRFPLLKQVIYFGLIGCFAAATQLLWESFFVEVAHLTPLQGNIFAFLIAVNVSYFGHRRFTFSETTIPHRQALIRFFWVAVFSFILNQGLFWILLSHTTLHYLAALTIVIFVVPPLTFAGSKFWAFGK